MFVIKVLEEDCDLQDHPSLKETYDLPQEARAALREWEQQRQAEGQKPLDSVIVRILA